MGSRISNFFLLLAFLALFTPPSTQGCSCLGPTGSTGAERAASVRELSDWIHIVFRGAILEKTSYDVGEWETYQNVTWSVDEILYNSNELGSLPANVRRDDNGSMTAQTSTMTTCCLCGKTIQGAVGEEYLVQLSTHRPETLLYCDLTCSIEDNSLCNDTASALRQNAGDSSSTATRQVAFATSLGSEFFCFFMSKLL